MANDKGAKENAYDLLDPLIQEYFNSFGHKEFTAVQQSKHNWGEYYFSGKREKARKSWVLETIYTLNQNIPSFNELFDQQCTVRYFLNNYDCVVQAPTGSGKTLAYLLPTLQILVTKREKQSPLNKCEIYALIVVPSRELVAQVADLLKPICKKLDFNLLRLVGGNKVKPEKLFQGQCIAVATPGSLEHYTEKVTELKNFFKTLLVLVIDEVDRFSSVEFCRSMTAFLSLLPKQRRTGLFSATQSNDVEEFMKFGLRNAVRMSVSGTKTTSITEGDLQKSSSALEMRLKTKDDVVTPQELINHYVEVNANHKLLALVNLLDSIEENAKVLLFCCSGACVEYFALILPRILLKQKEMFAIHRKVDKKKRLKVLEKFRKSKSSILLSTDLMARGLDVADIDWVLQYDIPKQSSMFIHRSGRTARSGKAGHSLVFLMSEEIGYLQFVQNHEKVSLKEWKVDGLNDEAANCLRKNIQELALGDRAILEAGTSAFVCFVEAYGKHDCQIVCRLRELDVIGVANAYALFRLPQMAELHKLKADPYVQFEARTDVSTAKIAYKDEKLEAKRQLTLVERKRKQPEQDAAFKRGGNRRNAKGPSTTIKRKKAQISEWDELKEEAGLLKKLKKRKLKRNEVDERLDEI